MKVAYHDLYVHPVPNGHKFPMEKYELLYRQLMHEGIIGQCDVIVPEIMPLDIVKLVHKQEYVTNLMEGTLSAREQRKTGFILSPQLLNRERVIMQGTLDLALHTYKTGEPSLNIAGGTHHAYSDRGEGFCLFNDFALAANYLLTQSLVNSVLIIDLDVHQGNGTASIFENDARVYTMSMHGADNYPLKKECSNRDVALATGTTDEEYLKKLKVELESLTKTQQPDVVFYQCGVDVLASDKLGKLALSLEGCKMRDKLVFETCYHNSWPMVAAMGGGYSKDIQRIVTAHKNTFEVVRDVWG